MHIISWYCLYLLGFTPQVPSSPCICIIYVSIIPVIDAIKGQRTSLIIVLLYQVCILYRNHAFGQLVYAIVGNRLQLLRGTIVNRTIYLLVKIGKYIGFCVYRRSY